jgi:hypothetical protein
LVVRLIICPAHALGSPMIHHRGWLSALDAEWMALEIRGAPLLPRMPISSRR